jgi:hypothetical protein
MKKSELAERFRIIKSKEEYGIIYQEFLTKKGCFVERYVSNAQSKLEILIFVGLNILPATRYFGHFPFNLSKELDANVSVVYQLGCSGGINRHFRRFTQHEAEQQYLEGLEIVRDFKGKVVIFSHSASTIEHMKLIFADKYKNFYENINIAGAIISATVTNIIVEMNKMWPKYRRFNWKHIFRLGKLFNIPLPIYPYFRRALHAENTRMRNLSIWINTNCASFFLNTDMKKTILNGKDAAYPILQLLPRYDCLFSPKSQERVSKYMSKKARVDLVKCDAEHNLFLSRDTVNIINAIKGYIGKI